MRTQSQIWNSKSQIKTKSKIKRQYKKYLSNCQNVFYQDHLQTIQLLNYLLRFIWPIFLLSLINYLIVYSIDPYQKPCPPHSTCGAYIHCNNGYLLNQEKQICQIDPRVWKSAQKIVDQTVDELQFKFGNQQCLENYIYTQQKLPQTTVQDIFKKNQIKGQLSPLKSAIIKILEDKNLQKLSGFTYYPLEKIVTPKIKQYSLDCKIILVYKNYKKTFIFLILLLLGLILFAVKYYYQKNQQKKALQIYNFLKEFVNAKIQINIQHYKLTIQQKFNKKKQISQKLWLRINQIRIKQELIGSYEDNSIKWKLIQVQN